MSETVVPPDGLEAPAFQPGAPARASDSEAARGDLTRGPVARTLLVFTLPTLGANVLQSLNGSIGAIFVGKLVGEDAFAAAGIAAMVLFLIFSLVFGLSMAATILIGQSMGRRDLEEVRRMFGASAGTFVAIGLVVALFGHLIAPPILHLLATPAAAFDHAVRYLTVVFYGVPVVLVMVLQQSALRGIGDAVTPLWATVVNLVLTLALNPVFILGWGPVPAMGLEGAAWAGNVANLASVVFMVARVNARDLPLRLGTRDLALLRPDWARLRPMLAMGLPMGLSMIIMSLASLAMLGLINREGVATVAAFNAAMQIWNYVQMPAFAVSSACSAMAAQNIGAGRWDRVGRITRTGVLANTVMTGVIVAILALLDRPLLGLFLPAGSDAIAIGERINLLIGWTFVPMGISMVYTSVVRANGAVMAPLAILVISVIGVRMGLGFGLYPRFGADAIWWAFAGSSTSSALLAAAYYASGIWRKERPRRHHARGERPATAAESGPPADAG